MKNYELIILGAGPAGISAGIYGVRAGVDCLVIDNGESALKKAKNIQNYYGIESISGKELFENGIKQYKNLGGKYKKEEILRIRYNWQDKTFSLFGKDEYQSKAIVLALGKGKKKSLPLLEKYENTNVSYCAVCDGFFYKGKNTAVIGDGEFAYSEAEELSKNAKVVYLISKNTIKNKKISKNIKIINENIENFAGKDKVEEIILANGDKLKVDGVFIALGSLSSFEIAKQVGINLKNDNIVVDKNFMTNVPGAFACGDCVGGLLQVSKAVGEGAEASIEAIRYIKILEEDETEKRSGQK